MELIFDVDAVTDSGIISQYERGTIDAGHEFSPFEYSKEEEEDEIMSTVEIPNISEIVADYDAECAGTFSLHIVNPFSRSLILVLPYPKFRS